MLFRGIALILVVRHLQCLLQLVAGDDYIGTLLGKCFGHTVADAPCAACDEYDLPSIFFMDTASFLFYKIVKKITPL